jgi:hypothetical protein
MLLITIHCGGLALGAHRAEGEADDGASALLELDDLRNEPKLRAALAQQDWILDTVVTGPIRNLQPLCADCARKMEVTGAPRTPGA